MSQNNEIFKQLCAQNINTLDDAEDQIFEDREHDNTYQTVVERQWCEKNDPAYNSSDSDDDSPPPGDELSSSIDRTLFDKTFKLIMIFFNA